MINFTCLLKKHFIQAKKSLIVVPLAYKCIEGDLTPQSVLVYGKAFDRCAESWLNRFDSCSVHRTWKYFPQLINILWATDQT